MDSSPFLKMTKNLFIYPLYYQNYANKTPYNTII